MESVPGIHRPGVFWIGYKKASVSGMMNEAKKRKFDALLVWKLGRLSRSMKDLTLDVYFLAHLRYK